MRISDWSSDVCSSDLKWLEGGDTRRDDHLRGAAVLAERQIEIVEDGEILQPVGWLDQQRGAEAVVVLVLEIAAAAEILRSEERRVGTECGSTCRYRWSQ